MTANVLHVDPSALAWTRYAVAAVPPVAAMLALAALLRQVYQMAGHRHRRPHPPRISRYPSRRPRSTATANQAAELFAEELALTSNEVVRN